MLVVIPRDVADAIEELRVHCNDHQIVRFAYRLDHGGRLGRVLRSIPLPRLRSALIHGFIIDSRTEVFA